MSKIDSGTEEKYKEEEREEEKDVMECIYRTGWDCPVKDYEVPLEVCNTCIEAKRTSNEEPIKISR